MFLCFSFLVQEKSLLRGLPSRASCAEVTADAARRGEALAMRQTDVRAPPASTPFPLRFFAPPRVAPKEKKRASTDVFLFDLGYVDRYSRCEFRKLHSLKFRREENAIYAKRKREKKRRKIMNVIFAQGP